MRNQNASGDFHPYPHLKLTSEEFPRLLATRKIEEDGSEFFGAFLNRTAVRIMIDLLSRTFKLRTCDIPVDGSFPVPCTQYYSRRCMAPCVASLCTPEEYARQVDIVRAFLLDDVDEVAAEMKFRIGSAADVLDFEKAAVIRDQLKAIEEFWDTPRFHVWLDDTVDTYGFEESDGQQSIFLLTQRGRRTIGTHVFDIPPGEIDAGEILSAAIKLMYKFHLPREIRVSGDFEGRLELARRLSERFGREVKIKVVPVQSLGVTAGRALFKSRIDRDINLLTKPEPVERTANRLKNMFGLSAVPKLIEAYDVAHISSTTFVAARVVHDIKARRTSEFEYINSTPKAEPAALAELVAKTHSSGDDRGVHLVLVDGGKTQLNAALGVLPPRGKRTFRVISAVKPPGKHSAISHFLTEDGDRIDFDVSIGAHRLLLGIRDQVHELSNSVHRLTRDMSGFYELAGILPSFSEAERQALVTEVGSIRRITDMSDEKISEMFDTKTAKRLIGDLARFRAGESAEVLPLVVPVRYDELDGEADDLRPIATRVGSAPQ